MGWEFLAWVLSLKRRQPSTLRRSNRCSATVVYNRPRIARIRTSAVDRVGDLTSRHRYARPVSLAATQTLSNSGRSLALPTSTRILGQIDVSKRLIIHSLNLFRNSTDAPF